jgi:hypothetical protein
MIPQMTVVADLTRSEDQLSLKPGYAVVDCHAHRLPSVREAQSLSLFILHIFISGTRKTCLLSG